MTSPRTDDTSKSGFASELERAKLDAMKELAYGASHEINNPLANITLRASALLKQEEDADKRKALEAIHRAAMRAHEMISDLMLFARPPALQKQSVSLREIAEAVVEELRPLAEQRRVMIDLSEGDAPCEADPTQLAVALRAVIENSLEAIGEEGAVSVDAGHSDAGAACLRVTDDGPGVPDEIRRHVFDPFFSGREAGRGLGFGLSKCWRIITDHGGEVTLDNNPGRGVTVTLTLPAE